MKNINTSMRYAFISIITVLLLVACSSEGLEDVNTDQELVDVVNDVADDNESPRIHRRQFSIFTQL